MVEDIRKAIIELEKKNYKIDEILISRDILKSIADNFNRFYGDNSLELSGIITLFGYDAGINVFDNSPVVFRTSIKINDILGSDDE